MARQLRKKRGESRTGSAGQRRFLDAQVLQKLGPLDLIAREVVEGLRVGMHRSPLKGFSTEFAQHRPYVAGDELKHIDWRVYSRTGRYFIKQYEAETNFVATLLLDASGSMRFASNGVTKLEYASYLAASLAHLIVDQRDSVGLGVFDSKLRQYVEPSSAPSIVRRIADALEQAQPEPRTDVGALLHEFANRIPLRGFVIVFSDLLDNVDNFLAGLQHLKFRGHNVVVFHTLDPAELEFQFDGTTRFEGLELDGEILTQPQRVRAAYLEEMQKFLDLVRGSCERAGVDYVLAETSRPVDVLLREYLISRVAVAGGNR